MPKPNTYDLLVVKYDPPRFAGSSSHLINDHYIFMTPPPLPKKVQFVETSGLPNCIAESLLNDHLLELNKELCRLHMEILDDLVSKHRFDLYHSWGSF